MKNVNRLLRLAALASQAVNVIIANGSPDETVSGRAYRRGSLGGDPGWLRVKIIIDKVFFFQKEHCRKSHEMDVSFAKMIMRAHL